MNLISLASSIYSEDFTGLVGKNCAPAIGKGATCESSPVCCKNAKFVRILIHTILIFSSFSEHLATVPHQEGIFAFGCQNVDLNIINLWG